MDAGEAPEKGAGAFGAAGGKKVRSFALSHGHSYHHLTYDPSDNNIEVCLIENCSEINLQNRLYLLHGRVMVLR